MGALNFVFLLAGICFVSQANGGKTYRDMFPHKHTMPGKLPFPIPPIPGWDPGKGKFPFPIPPIPGWSPDKGKLPFPIPPIPGFGPDKPVVKSPNPMPQFPGWDPGMSPYPIPPFPGWDPSKGKKPKPDSDKLVGDSANPIPQFPGWDPGMSPYPIPPFPGWDPSKGKKPKPDSDKLVGDSANPMPQFPGWDPGMSPYPIPPFPGWDPSKGKKPKPDSDKLVGDSANPMPQFPGWDPGMSPYPIPPFPGWDPSKGKKPKPDSDKLVGDSANPLPQFPGWDPGMSPYPIPPFPGWDPSKGKKPKPDSNKLVGDSANPMPQFPGWDPGMSPYPIPPFPGWDPSKGKKPKPDSDKLVGDSANPMPQFPGWDPGMSPYPIPPFPGWDPSKGKKPKPDSDKLVGDSANPMPQFPGWDPGMSPYPIPPFPGWDPSKGKKPKPDSDKLIGNSPYPVPPLSGSTDRQVGKLPFPIPPIPGWEPDTNTWDETLYPPLYPKSKELTHRKGKPKIRLTSDSPAINGSSISFTAKLEYPPCQKEDANGDLIWDDHCEDGMELEASANGQVRSGYVYNWTSWLDNYGFDKCTDKTKCDVFPDGKPFPQSNDWRQKGYVYVWHTMGQYFETCDGSSSSLTLDTTTFPLGAEVMEVLVYRKRERRKYSPLSTDNSVFYVTDKIPVAVNISQKAAVNQSANVFYRGEDVVFQVKLHDPSGYLKTAAAIDYIWDFRDGNQLVTHRDVTTHTYSALGTMSVKLVVEASFPIECPPAAATPTPRSPTPPPPTEAPTIPPGTHAVTTKMETTQVLPTTRTSLPSSAPITTTTGLPTTEPLPPTVAPDPTAMAWLRSRHVANQQGCFRYIHGTFSGNISIIEPKHKVESQANSRIVDVSAARVTNTDINFLVKCLGSIPTSACTIVSDHTCTQVRNIMCDDVPPTSACEVRLRRTFLEPGTYCVNITLEDSRSMALASTTVTINKSQDAPASKTPHTAEVVLSASAVLVAVFSIIGYLVYKRYKVYRPIRRSLVEDACIHSGVGGRVLRLREALFPSSEESHHLLTERRPL